ncbi:MAG: hypothetical protein P8R54_26035 [Myxococcota bacterium]|nr:hypothetical protein [Myxococcota bacterium]
MLLILLTACAPEAPEDSVSSGSDTVPWSGSLVPTRDELPDVRGLSDRRGLIHLHSPYSHDACDGEPLIDGAPNAPCLADLRAGLCATAMDFAYVTDHPTHAAAQTYSDLLFIQGDDVPVEQDGEVVAKRMFCESGHSTLWMPGIEDELMPVGLHAHAGETPEQRDAIYRSGTVEALQAERDAGALVFTAHTEGRDRADLEMLVDAGLTGVEIFNLHAMFDPGIRSEDLGLDSLGWLKDIAPFTSADGTAEPDLFFLAVLSEQTPSIEHWDALQARGPVVGVAGTDAHQNVLPLLLRDGERGDSYRRMMRWLSNHLLVASDAPSDYDEALAAGRAYVAFEILGTPTGLDWSYHHNDTTYEMGSRPDSTGGTLTLSCPTLTDSSPRGAAEPDIEATIFKDGEPWKQTCGEFTVEDPGIYRVRIDITPWHLEEFLGEEPAAWLTPRPWIYTNTITVGSSPQ